MEPLDLSASVSTDHRFTLLSCPMSSVPRPYQRQPNGPIPPVQGFKTVPRRTASSLPSQTLSTGVTSIPAPCRRAVSTVDSSHLETYLRQGSNSRHFERESNRFWNLKFVVGLTTFRLNRSILALSTGRQKERRMGFSSGIEPIAGRSCSSRGILEFSKTELVPG